MKLGWLGELRRQKQFSAANEAESYETKIPENKDTCY